jgi:hypothetical protein
MLFNNHFLYQDVRSVNLLAMFSYVYNRILDSLEGMCYCCCFCSLSNAVRVNYSLLNVKSVTQLETHFVNCDY